MVELADAKQFLSVDFDDDDLIIFEFIEAAENHLTSIGVDLEVAPLPAAIRQAIFMLVGHFYENREAVSTGFAMDTPVSVNRLIAPYTEITL